MDQVELEAAHWFRNPVCSVNPRKDGLVVIEFVDRNDVSKWIRVRVSRDELVKWLALSWIEQSMGGTDNLMEYFPSGVTDLTAPPFLPTDFLELDDLPPLPDKK